MDGRFHRALRRVRPLTDALACGICFGLAGLVWSLPALRSRRQRRAATCTVCASHQRIRGVAVGAIAVLLLAGTGARVQEAVTPQIVCHSHITPDGQIEPEPLLHISPPPVWHVTRNVLVAPISGVGVLVGYGLGMQSCSGPPFLVMFWPPPRTSGGGSALGDVFVAWMPPTEPARPGDANAYGTTREHSYIRYGPNISGTRANEEELGIHESRHVDQWAVANLLAGPFSFPVAYFVDEALFPGERNHFERAAGLDDGSYPPVDDNWPAPRWPETAGIAAIVLVIMRRRIRWLARVAIAGRLAARAHAPMRCPTHSTGWTHV